MKKYGPYVDSDPAFVQGAYEPEIVAALLEHARPGEVFFDIGANVGYHMNAARASGRRRGTRRRLRAGPGDDRRS